MHSLRKTGRLLLTTLCFTAFSATAYSSSSNTQEPLGAYSFSPEVERSFTDLDLQQNVQSLVKTFEDTRGALQNLPDACKNVRYKTYEPVNLVGGEIDAHLFLTAGIFQDTNAFVHFAENFVYTSQQDRNLDIAVHVIARRDSCLHDREGLEQAIAAQDTNIAIEYYYGKQETAIDKALSFLFKLFGGSYDNTPENFKGFHQPKDESIAFLSEFSLEQMINDIDQVIDAEANPLVNGKDKVFLGGQSMGGILSAVYSSWDFDGDASTTEDAGFNKVNGFVALDTLITTSSSKLIGYDILPEWLGLDGLSNPQLESYYAGLDDLRNRETSLYVNFEVGFTPATFMLFTLMGMEAAWAPREESTLFSRLPYESNPSLAAYVRLTHAQSISEYLFLDPKNLPQRYTNAAILGLSFDENFAPATVTHSSFGFLKNVEVQPKHFPVNTYFRWLFPDITKVVGHYLALVRSYGLHANEASKDTVVDWANFDEIGNKTSVDFLADNDPNVKLSGLYSEMSDINQFARSQFKGDATFFGWYMSSRLIHDIRFFNILPNDESTGLKALHRDQIPLVRKIEFIGTEGVDWPGGEKWSTALVPLVGYDHADVLTASFNTPSRRKNMLLEPLYDFIEGKGEF